MSVESQKKEVYVAHDGTEFGSEKECKRYIDNVKTQIGWMKKKVYVAPDGTEFSSEKECKQYVAMSFVRDNIDNIVLPPHRNKRNQELYNNISVVLEENLLGLGTSRLLELTEGKDILWEDNMWGYFAIILPRKLTKQEIRYVFNHIIRSHIYCPFEHKQEMYKIFSKFFFSGYELNKLYLFVVARDDTDIDVKPEMDMRVIKVEDLGDEEKMEEFASPLREIILNKLSINSSDSDFFLGQIKRYSDQIEKASAKLT